MKKSIRNLQHSKSARVQIGQGTPSPKEGSNGDLSLRLTKTGVKLFAKFRNKWYIVGQGNLNQVGGEDQDQLFGINKEKITNIDKKGKIKIKEKGGIDLYPWTIKSVEFDSTYATLQGLQFSRGVDDMVITYGKAGAIQFEDSSANGRPQLEIINRHNTSGGPILMLRHIDAGGSAIAQPVGSIYFNGTDDGDNGVTYGVIMCQCKDATDGDERGYVLIQATTDSGSNPQFGVYGGEDGANNADFQNCPEVWQRGGDGYNFVVDINGKYVLDGSGGDTYISSAGDDMKFYCGGDQIIYLVEIAGAGNFTTIDGGTITAAVDNASSDIYNFALEVKTVLNDTSDSGTSKYKMIKGVATNTDITGWDELYLLHLTGAGTTWINNAGSIAIPAAQKIYLDGGTDASNGHSYIVEGADDRIDIVAGGDIMIRLLENGTDGNSVNFSTTCAGFTQLEPTFDATDTEVDFRHSNKQKLTLTNNCTDIHFQFPAMSGNFLCVLLQDGTGGRTISNWKTKDSAGNAGAGNSGLVQWAGGTAPENTETANKADIASFYWDADNEIAYGVYTYKF